MGTREQTYLGLPRILQDAVSQRVQAKFESSWLEVLAEIAVDHPVTNTVATIVQIALAHTLLQHLT